MTAEFEDALKDLEYISKETLQEELVELAMWRKCKIKITMIEILKVIGIRIKCNHIRSLFVVIINFNAASEK